MQSDPLILSFDTSAAYCAAALLSGNNILDTVYEPMLKGQAERLFPVLERLLKKHSAVWSALTAIGVCTGPGNFTGVRISVAAARGLSLSLGIPVVGVTKLEAMAYKTKGKAICVLDARRKHIYTQSFEYGLCKNKPQMIENKNIKTDNANIYTMDNEALSVSPSHMSKSVPEIVGAITHLTAQNYKKSNPCPAPLYLRPADATLPSEPPIPILP